MSNTLTELKPIKEKLLFKWDVVECLQNMLVKTGLQVAEKDAIIHNLKQWESDVEDDVKTLEKDSTTTLSHWQEAFLSTKIREADVILEFDKLKRSLASIKYDLEEKKLETMHESNKEDEDFFHIRFNLRDRFHEKIKLEEEESIARTVELQNEIDYLKMQIKKLEDIREDINKSVSFNEKVKVHLHEVRTSISIRSQKTNQIIDRVIEKYKKLEKKMNSDLLQIQHNIDCKNVKISQLVEEIKNLQLRVCIYIILNNLLRKD
ncbi:hypothetical protein NQ314_003621 [Rhamnusium bicolor]|uniref:Uncharacterized protein n=1 Tax=Rhamnusium bicolor TaxID=1586634 RepID=A0AAV8ZNV1_9CUCU|nr:hypothetical protein NQ314_003621 [Rhamnusium bicolor]